MLADLVERLKQVVKQRHPDCLQQFEEILGKVAVLDNPACIPLLLPFFEDDAEHDEMMFSLIHTIEAFEDRVYVEKVLDGLRKLFAKSPTWAAVIHMRILNSPSTLAAYTERLKDLPQEQTAVVRDVLEAVRRNNARFNDRCQALLAKI